MEIPQNGKIQYSRRNISEKVKQEKKMVGRGGGQLAPTKHEYTPRKASTISGVMMRTRPAASRDACERPPWQGWELSLPTAPSTLRSRASPTARLPCARPCPRAPSHRYCPSAQALGPPPSQVGGRPRLGQAGPAPHPQPSANTPPPAASGARAGPALARCDQLRPRPGHCRLQPTRGLPRRVYGAPRGHPGGGGTRIPPTPWHPAPGEGARWREREAGRSPAAPSKKKAPSTAIHSTLPDNPPSSG